MADLISEFILRRRLEAIELGKTIVSEVPDPFLTAFTNRCYESKVRSARERVCEMRPCCFLDDFIERRHVARCRGCRD
jgi:hypothetical protein